MTANANTKQTNYISVILSLDVRDDRLHEGIARFFHATTPSTHIQLRNFLPWSRMDRETIWAGAVIETDNFKCDNKFRRNLQSLPCPAVLIGPANRCVCPQVLVDNYQAGRMAAEYFLNLKFRHFAIAGQGVDPGMSDRIRGFEDTLSAHGFSARHMIYSDYVHHEKSPGPKLGWDVFLTKNIGEATKPLAIFALDDWIGGSVLRHCSRANIRIPEEVAVLGVGNKHIFCDYTSPPLSSIDMNQEQMGWKAAKILHGMIEGETPPDKPLIIPPLGIVERRSTEILSADNPMAMRALLYLWDNLANFVSPAEAARTVGVSRPYLDRLFLSSFGRTVKEELTRIRMQRVREMLATTNVPLKTIAAAVGFRTPEHMSRVFFQENEATLRQFRSSLTAGETYPWETTQSTSRLIRKAGGQGGTLKRKKVGQKRKP